MTKIAIIYHSGYGHTEVQAKYVQKGAASVDGVEAKLFKVEDIKNATELNEFKAIIFGAPTYMGSVSAQFKAFMDATSGVWFAQQWKDKIAAGFTNSNSMSGDKFNSLVQLVTFAAQHGMIWTSLGELNHSSVPNAENGGGEYVNRIGSYLGAMAQSDNAPTDQTPPIGDLKTAEILGQRVANIAKRFVDA